MQRVTARQLDPEKPHMNWNIIEGKWKELTGSVREKWGDLTDDDIQQIAGKRDRLEGVLKQKYGMAQEEISRQIDDWTGTLNERVSP